MSLTKKKINTAIWWEKTVEYKFICDCFEKGIIKQILPLDGNEERLGDAITLLENSHKDDVFYILEFKKKLSNKEFKHEKTKFPGNEKGYNSAWDCLTPNKNERFKKAHYFIAAKYEDEIFQLFVRDYFSYQTTKTKTIEESFGPGTGLTIEDFKTYACYFTTHKQTKTCIKCRDGDDRDSRGDVPSDDPKPRGGKKEEEVKSMVVAINPHTKACTIFPLEWIHILKGEGGQSLMTSNPDTGGSGGGEVTIQYLDWTKIRISDADKPSLAAPDELTVEIAG
ncbi:hypothetical protein EDF88_4464 [Buttiauxella sp. BIGb0552]|uniref:hypothetical protein n=1 Tax=Buttiauxella sp. BIGb0552 TaxID=2485120 RepID=UPI0010667E0C|nr:hypothetical protein [Buttiauxella sp. BIGb0552]TDX11867.1 hypothetical protein EDF88_4464 [Buttiauxella sp. BIGb0552]